MEDRIYMPKFSLIIPVYNVEAYLRECLESILRQPMEDWEAIVIDDGSSDRSGAIADEYAAKDGRIMVIHQENQGVSVARNVGLEKAMGQWIWFIDSDDYIVDNALMVLSYAIKKTEGDTIFFGYRRQYGELVKDKLVTSLDSIEKRIFLERFYCYGNWALLFSNEIIKQHGIRFTIGLRMAEDLEFQYKYLYYCQTPVSISECLYVYRHRENSATTNANTCRNNMNDCIAVSRNLLGFAKILKGSEHVWLSLRIRNILKASLQAAERLTAKDRCGLQRDLREVLDGYKEIGYNNVEDRTLSLARWNLNLYFLCLKIFYRLRGIKFI